MTFDMEANARQLLKELHEKGYEDAAVYMGVTVFNEKSKWEANTISPDLDRIGTGYSLSSYSFDCPVEAYEAAEKAIAALPDKHDEARADLGKPRIKPLAWKSSHGISRAKTPFGEYLVGARTLTLPLPMQPQQVHKDERSAKAAAQADYERRILEALG